MRDYDLKLTIGRHQLGAALELFIQDKDPFSVHSLACGACEIIEGLATTKDIKTMTEHILATNKDVDIKKVRKLKNEYWNAFKHVFKLNSDKLRDDTGLIDDFSDIQNDTVLFVGWYDYADLTGKMPIEAQIFQTWWCALNPERINPDFETDVVNDLFSDIKNRDRKQQKLMLKYLILNYLADEELKSDPRTENEPLLYDNHL